MVPWRVHDVAAAATPTEAEIATQFARAINDERAARGLAPVTVQADPGGAQESAEEMRRRGEFGHFVTVVNAAEVVTSAVVSGTAVTKFMGSDPHRAILMKPSATSIAVGVACTADGSRFYLSAWVKGPGISPTADPQPVVTQPGSGVGCTATPPPVDPPGEPPLPPPVDPGPTPPPATNDGSQAYSAVGPYRLADTRSASCGCQRVDPFTIRVPVAGVGPVPANATAASLTVTIVEGNAAGYATVWPAGTASPGTSNLNYGPGQARANGVIVSLSGGAVDVYASTSAHIIVDVNGAFFPASTSTAGRFTSVPPARVLDTRGGARPGAGATLTVPLPAGVPADATAIAANITLTQSADWGYAVAWPAGLPMPGSSIVNVDAAGQTRAAFAVVPVSASGMALYTYGGAHLLVDVVGYFTGTSAPSSSDGLLVSQAPSRVVDTRSSRPQYPQETLTSNSVPNAAALVTNVTMTGSWSDSGYMTAYPAGTGQPGTSTLNAAGRGLDVANLSITQRSTTGVSWFNSAGSHLIVDVYGYFTGAATPGASPPSDPALVAPVTFSFGTSVEGRPLVAHHRKGSEFADRVILVVGVIHGNERAGELVVDRLLTQPLPGDVDLWLIESLNPDGQALGGGPNGTYGQSNANGVNLNRNFPASWESGTFYSSGQYYGGPYAGSEPETQAAMHLAAAIHPDWTVWYHQPWGTVDCDTGRVGSGCVDYASSVGLSVSFAPRPGTATDWIMSNGLGHSFVVEFSAATPGDPAVAAHANAVLSLS